MKLNMVIQYTSGHCWKEFQGQKSMSNRMIVKQKVKANGRKQLTPYSTLWV